MTGISFGVPAAERDEDLYDCLSPPKYMQIFREGKKTIILGNRGSGKSALFKMLAREERAVAA